VKSQNGMRSPVELLYGDSLQPMFSTTNGWQLMPNKMNVEPTFGPAGFFNTYDWAMANFQGQLYVGTFDWSFLLVGLLNELLEVVPGITPEEVTTIVSQVSQSFSPGVITFGADLWRFPSPNSAAVVESQFGVGNFPHLRYPNDGLVAERVVRRHSESDEPRDRSTESSARRLRVARTHALRNARSD
jgi:hypothetical protein